MKNRTAYSIASILLCFLVLTAAYIYHLKSTKDDGMITIQNKYISISLSKSNGSIVSIFDKVKGIEFLKKYSKSTPFRLKREEDFEESYQSFSYKKESQFKNGTGYELTWKVNHEVKVIGRVELPENTNEINFYVEVVNNSDKNVLSVEYPVIPNITTITKDGMDDYLAHSFATGFLIHNPMENFKKKNSGLRFMPYPEGFSGNTMQFFTYYGKSKGGLYFAAYDGSFYPKWLNFYKNENNLLEASFINGYEDIGPNKGIKTTYPIVIKTLNEGSWYEAADIYKSWAVNQIWCSKGELSKVSDNNKVKWLLEDTGLSTFGIDSSYDRTQWIDKYHELVGTNVFHVLGPDWSKKTQDYYNHFPGGFDDWFPAKFNSNNINAIKSLGDKSAPFEFDYLFNALGADGPKGRDALQAIPQHHESNDGYDFPFLCPDTDFTKSLHIKRDENLEKQYNVDAVYYDISANNILKVCMNENHGHKIGGGQEITEAYRQNYLNSKKAMSEAGKKYVAQGTEMINEAFVDVLDYYQARAGAQPAASFEESNLRELVKSGEAELIPMFTYVYHEYGPVRLDGWGKLSKEPGDLFYFTSARTYLWGGLYELNYEYAPMEAINGKENDPTEHYYQFQPQNQELVPEMGEYLKQFAKLRTGLGNKYLAYGNMLRPLDIKSDKIDLSWHVYNTNMSFGEYNDFGYQIVDSVINSAWKYQNKSAALFFANVSKDKQDVNVNINLSLLGLSGNSYKIRLIQNEKPVELGEIEGKENKQLSISIPARTVVMLEIS